MTRSLQRRALLRRATRAVLVLTAAASLLAACGQASSSTTVVLTGPPDKVQALIGQHKLLTANVQAQMSKLPDGRERAVLRLAKGLPLGEIVALGKDAAKVGISYEFSSGTHWSDGAPPPDDQFQPPPGADAPAPDAPAKPPAKPSGRVV